MNLKLLKPSVFTLCLLAISFNSTAQKLKTQPNQKNIKKGQVYKNQKMFDSKTGATNSKTPIQRQADNAIERANYEFKRLKTLKQVKYPQVYEKLKLVFLKK